MSNFKSVRIRDKKHLAFVASLPCACCGIMGSSQAAHITRGGMGLKAGDDQTIPLCSQRPGITGCHFDSEKKEKAYFEKYGGYSKIELLSSELYKNSLNIEVCLNLILRFRAGLL